MKKIIFFLFVALCASFAQSANCYWRGPPICGLGERCGSDIFIRNEFTEECIINPDVYCCPRGDGNDLMLCEDSDWKGDCITHSVMKKSCVNVDKMYWASSVDPLGNCFRLHNGRDCGGKSIAVYPGLDSTNNLTKLGFDDQVVSVSNCFEADGEGSSDSRLKRYIFDELLYGDPLYDDALYDYPHDDDDDDEAYDYTNNNGEPIWHNILPNPYYQQGVHNRTEKMVTMLDKRRLGNGTATNIHAKEYAKKMGRPNDDASHILAQRLGGSGTDTRNIFPQNRKVNRRVFYELEHFVYKFIQNFDTAKYIVSLIYSATGTRPLALVYQLYDEENVLVFKQAIPNL